MATGRFLQVDPLHGDLRNPQSLNRYAYVQGDPVNLMDPLGLLCSIGGQIVDISRGECEQRRGQWVDREEREESRFERCALSGIGCDRPGRDPIDTGGGGGGGGASGEKKAAGSKQNNRCKLSDSWTNLIPRGGGVLVGAQASAGALMLGASSTASSGVGAFFDNGLRPSLGAFNEVGQMASAGGNVASYPEPMISPLAGGASASAGGGLFFTNARDVGQLQGPFATWQANINIGPGFSFELSFANGVYVLSVTGGVGEGASGIATTTKTNIARIAGEGC